MPRSLRPTALNKRREAISQEKKPHLWCAYNVVSKTHIKGLLLNELRAITSRVEPGERLDWFVWQEGWDRWMSLRAVPQLHTGEARKLSMEPPLLPDLEEEFEKTEVDSGLVLENSAQGQESSIINLTQHDSLTDAGTTAAREFIARAHERISKRLKIEIELGTRKFQTHSVDISPGGVLLEDSMPDWVVGYCTIRIYSSQKKQAVELACSVVENQDPHKRVRVSLLPLKTKDSEQKFAHWIKAA